MFAPLILLKRRVKKEPSPRLKRPSKNLTASFSFPPGAAEPTWLFSAAQKKMTRAFCPKRFLFRG